MRNGDGGVGPQGHFALIAALVLGQQLVVFRLTSFCVGGTLVVQFLEAVPEAAFAVAFIVALNVFVVLFAGIFVELCSFLARLSLDAGLYVAGRLLRGFAEPLVGLLEERNVVVELFHVERAVQVERAVVRDAVAQRGSVFEVGAAHPVVGGVVAGIGIHPVENGDEVQRQLVAGGEVLVVVEGRAHALDAAPDAVFPRRVFVGVKRFVDGSVGFFNLGMGAAVEVEVQVAGDVPAQGELAVPEELLVEGQGELCAVDAFHVAFLQFAVNARHFGVERNVLRQVVQPETLQDVKPFALLLGQQLLERLEGLIYGRVAVVHASAPLVLVLIDGGLAAVVAM